MGCKPSRLQVQFNGDLFNEDIDIRKIFLTGIHISKGATGIEGIVLYCIVLYCIVLYKLYFNTEISSLHK